MHTFRLSLSLVLVISLLVMPTARAAVLHFDDLISLITPWHGPVNPNNGNQQAWVPWGYGGYIWNDHPQLSGGGQATLAVTYQDGFTGEPTVPAYAGGGLGNTYPFPSPKMAVTNLYGTNPVAIMRTDGGLFDFEGAWFSSLGLNKSFAGFSARSITLTGYRGDVFSPSPHEVPSFGGGTPVMSLTVDLSTSAFLWVAAGFEAIDKLEIRANVAADFPSATGWVMDDFSAAPVPLPGAGALLVCALGVLAARRTRIS